MYIRDSKNFQSSSQTATCYNQSNNTKVEAIPLSPLPKDTTSKLAGLSPHYPFKMLNAKSSKEAVNTKC